MADLQPIRIAILGGGKGGSALLDLLFHLPDVTVIGLADNNPSAPGLIRAQDLSLTATPSVTDLIANPDVNFIVNVTGDPEVDRLVLAQKKT